MRALLLGLLVPLQVHAALNILACEPEWGALAKEIGGDKVNVYTATTAMQDPHRIEARPSLMARARNADLMVCTGAELEIGWAPLLQTQSGNAKIQGGQPGYFDAASAGVHMPSNSPARSAFNDVFITFSVRTCGRRAAPGCGCIAGRSGYR